MHHTRLMLYHTHSHKWNDRKTNKLNGNSKCFPRLTLPKTKKKLIVGRSLTVHLPHCSGEIRRIFEAHEAKAFRFIGTCVSDHFCLLKWRKFAENAGQYLICYIIAEITAKDSVVIWKWKENDQIGKLKIMICLEKITWIPFQQRVVLPNCTTSRPDKFFGFLHFLYFGFFCSSFDSCWTNRRGWGPQNRWSALKTYKVLSTSFTKF